MLPLNSINITVTLTLYCTLSFFGSSAISLHRFSFLWIIVTTKYFEFFFITKTIIYWIYCYIYRQIADHSFKNWIMCTVEKTIENLIIFLFNCVCTTVVATKQREEKQLIYQSFFYFTPSLQFGKKLGGKNFKCLHRKFHAKFFPTVEIQFGTEKITQIHFAKYRKK